MAFMLAMSAGVTGVVADGSDPLDPSDGGADWDGDGLTNAEEQAAGTDMNNADTDNDGLPDGWEVAYGLNPNSAADGNADPDGDGLTNAQEYAAGTNPNSADTDGDGINVVKMPSLMTLTMGQCRIQTGMEYLMLTTPTLTMKEPEMAAPMVAAKEKTVKVRDLSLIHI